MDNKSASLLLFPMDAEMVISALIAKLQIESTKVPLCPLSKHQVLKAIKNLQLMKVCLKVAEDHEALKLGLKVAQHNEASFRHSENDEKMYQLLRAVYSVDDAADILQLTREAFHRKRQNGPQQRFQWPPITFFLCSQILFTNEMKKFKHVFRDFYRLLEKKDTAALDIKDIRLSFKYDQEGWQAQQQKSVTIADFCFKEETDFVFEEEGKKLHDLAKDSINKVIALVGQGGSGKTTLVRKVYNKLLLGTKSFSRYAWVNVPTLFRASYVLAGILKQIKQNGFAADATASEEELISELIENLKENKFLIVIEDVESTEVWKALQLRRLFHQHNSGSKIIITTRKKEVALYAYDHSTESPEIDVSKLKDNESWNLFKKKVEIVDEVSTGKSELNITLERLVAKLCAGLPLEIDLLLGLLSTKESSYHERPSVIERAKSIKGSDILSLSYNECSSVIERAKNFKGDIFALSYQELSSQVKPCFLYMGLFPKGFEIPVRRLIHLWVSEGFVNAPLESGVETAPEDLAEVCFKELVTRNMIQVRWRLDGKPKTCCMPGALYDVFSRKAAELGFFYNQFQSSHEDSSTKQPRYGVRRLAACLGIKIFRSSFIQVEHLRSFVAFDTRLSAGIPSGEIGMFLEKSIGRMGFGLLKVLDLEGVYKPSLSEEAIGKLLLLTYLGLRSTCLDTLPPSVSKLHCLESLDVKHTMIYDLPASTWLAKKLRHLYLNWSCSSNFSSWELRQAEQPPPTNLLTLWGLSISSNAFGFLNRLAGLRKLGVTCTSESTAEATANWISNKLTKLRSLKLRSIQQQKESNEVLDLVLPNMKMLPKLEELYLLGGLKPMKADEFPPKLRMLTLSQSRLNADPMPVLGQLPNLQILRLFGNSYKGKEIKCPREGFPKLLVLKLWNLPLCKWRVEKGAMRCLRELEIRGCQDLQPFEGLQRLTTLKKVEIIDTPDFVVKQRSDLYIIYRHTKGRKSPEEAGVNKEKH